MRLPLNSSVAVALMATACVPGVSTAVAIVAPSATAVPAASADVVHPDVHRRLQTSGLASVVVSMREERPSRLLNASHRRLARSAKPKDCESGFDESSPATRTTHNSIGISDESVETMVEGLEDHATDEHKEVMELLASQSTSGSSSLSNSEPAYSAANSLWISNEIVIRDATRDLIDKLALLSSVGSIREEAVAHIPITAVPFLTDNESSSNDGGVESRQQQRRRRLDQDLVGEWGVERVHALDAWRQGWFGNGTRVAIIDSGVRLTHSVLQGNFVGDFGWFDPLADSPTPQDSSGHGTGVMGVLTGAIGLGVAPGATWMACRACDAANDCREGDLLECAQFLTCPFTITHSTTNTTNTSSADTSQVTRNCSARPQVINNSWNLDRGATTFQSAVDVWVAAGIVPVFSAGNAGPSCATISAPADASKTSISVGSTDYSDQLSAFSARGPGMSGNIKPDVVAPGETVVSAGYESDSSLVLLSGTSIAAPHVSGTIALLAGAFPALSVSSIVQLLQQAASPAVGVTAAQNSSCLSAASSGSSLPVPNNAFGYGMVDVSKAIAIQQSIGIATTAPIE